MLSSIHLLYGQGETVLLCQGQHHPFHCVSGPYQPAVKRRRDTVDAVDMRSGATARDYGWLSLAVLMGGLTVLNVAASVGVAVVGGDLRGLVRLPVSILFGYWIGVGAWRRTSWGRVTVDADAMAPVLDATGTRRLIVLGAACCIVPTFALALQVVEGRS